MPNLGASRIDKCPKMNTYQPTTVPPTNQIIAPMVKYYMDYHMDVNI